MTTPPFTPLEATEMAPGLHDDWYITFDGPQCSPPEYWFPCVEHIPTQSLYVPTGEETTEESEWYPCP